jgi:hypothetical protein
LCADLHRPAQRFSAAETLLKMEPLRMQSRQPGQQLSIEPIGFGVLIVVGPQISGQRDSGIAGGSHHNGDVVLSRRDALPELLEILRAGTKADIAPKQLPVASAQAARCSALQATSMPILMVINTSREW